MKKLSVLIFLMAASSAAIPSSAAASAANCRQDSAQAAECRTLATCFLIGAGIFNDSTAQEAVTWTRNCLTTHRQFKRTSLASGRSDAFRRAKRLRAYQSTFRSLYCMALDRAGQRDARICEIRRSGNGRRSGGGGGRNDSGTRSPTLTG